MTELQILADDKLSKLDVSLYVAVFVFVVAIIPFFIVLAIIKNRKADMAEEKAAEAEQTANTDSSDPEDSMIKAEVISEEKTPEDGSSEDNA